MQMLQQLNDANEGLAKLSNMQPETMRELVSNMDLDSMLEGAEEEIPPPMVTVTDEDGNQHQITPEEAGVEWDPETDGVLDLKLHEELKKRIESGEAVDISEGWKDGKDSASGDSSKDGGGDGSGDGSGDGGGDGSGDGSGEGCGEEKESATNESEESNALDGSGDNSVSEVDMHGSDVVNELNSAWSGINDDTSSGTNADSVSSSIDDA